MSPLNIRNLFTLVNHSLRQEARSVTAHRFRIGSLLISIWMLVSAHYYSWFSGSIGREFIRSLTYLDLMLILVAGSSYFGSVITEEKEQGTLGLLKLAGFSNAGLMFGKSSTRIVTALVIFLMQLPFAFLAIILGGTSVTQIVAAYLTLAGYLIFLGNVGLFLSVICQRNSSATSLTFLVGLMALISGRLATLALSAGFAKKIAAVRGALESVVHFQEWFSAETRLNEALLTRQTPLVTSQFWASLGLGGLLFVLAWVLFDRFTEHMESYEPHRATRSPRLARWRFWISRPRGNGLAWKEFHFASGGYSAMLGKTILLAGLIGGTHLFDERFRALYGTSLTEILHGVLIGILLVELLFIADQFLGGEYAGGTLPNLLLTPHSLARIVASKLWGALLTLLPTLLAIGIESFQLRGRDAVLLDWNARDVVLLGGFVLLLHLTTFYSIKVRRGAVAWATATLMIGMVIVLPVLEIIRRSLLGKTSNNPFMQQSSGPEFWAPFIYASVLICLSLQIAIAAQIRRATGE